MTIGVILTAFQAESFIAPGPDCTIQAWFDLAPRWEGHKVLIAAVCVPFEGFDSGPLDNTRALLQRRVELGHIQHLVTSETPMKETNARGRALQWLVGQGADLLVQWDSDEVATERDLRAMIAFVEANPYVDWFRLSLRNAVFSPTSFLKEPFTPPRIHRVESLHSGRAIHFWDDNNIAYSGGILRRVVPDIELASVTIPPSVAWPVHLSWLDDQRSRCKQAYQRVRWGHCSFRWNDATGHLEWDEAYYAKRGLPLPEVVRE